MVLFERAQRPHNDARVVRRFHLAQIGRAQAGGTEPRHAGIARQTRNLPRISQRGGQWLIDEQRLVRGNHLPGLLQVPAAIVAFEQDAIHHGQESGDIRNDLNTIRIVYLFREALHARGALRNIRAATFVSRDNVKAGHKTGSGGIVEYPGEDRNVRGVGSDNTQPKISGAGA